jgi:hypothetical protein
MTHAQERALERYNLHVYTADFVSIQQQIRDGEAEKIRGRGRTSCIYRVMVQGIICIVVYNRRDKYVVTFLPANWEDSRCVK